MKRLSEARALTNMHGWSLSVWCTCLSLGTGKRAGACQVLASETHHLNTCLLHLQWKGLPYGECTWEKYDDILKAGGPECVQQLKVSGVTWHVPLLPLLVARNWAILSPSLGACPHQARIQVV